MAPFRYKDLSGTQIRLATLHSGAPQDDIRLSITHVPLAVSGPRRQPTLQRIQKELPVDWRVQEEQPKQLIFQHRNESGEWEPQRTHPDASLDMRRYEKQRNPVSFEALSYTWGSITNAEMAYVVPCPESAGPEESKASTLAIGLNLASALRDLRYEDRPRTL